MNHNEQRNGNASMRAARALANDEFYTRRQDIEAEVSAHRSAFAGKSVHCPCDDYRTSQFARFFRDSFHDLGLRRLVCTNRDNGGGAWLYTYDGESEKARRLKGDGSFDSPECRKAMASCDIVATNPPFSLFRKFVSQVLSMGKGFLAVCSDSAATYGEVFPHIADGSVSFGATRPTRFATPLSSVGNPSTQRMEDGVVYQRFGNTGWLTNLPQDTPRRPFEPKARFSPGKYQRYDNHDAIDVPRVADIPSDYGGVMGVPVTYLQKHDPSQFEIVGSDRWEGGAPVPGRRFSIGGDERYARVLIRRPDGWDQAVERAVDEAVSRLVRRHRRGW